MNQNGEDINYSQKKIFQNLPKQKEKKSSKTKQIKLIFFSRREKTFFVLPTPRRRPLRSQRPMQETMKMDRLGGCSRGKSLRLTSMGFLWVFYGFEVFSWVFWIFCRPKGRITKSPVWGICFCFF